MPPPLIENGRNNHAPSTVKRSIMRALRLFFLQGWAWYQGHLISSPDRLAAFFPAADIAYVQTKVRARRHWWFERDPLFHLKGQDGAVHVPRPGRGRPAPVSERLTSLKLLTYNCQSLGRGSTRLQELAEDMHSVGVTVAALQGTRWKSGDGRSEWPIRSFDGKSHFTCFSWGTPSHNRMLGVQILVSQQLLKHGYVHTRFDPPHGLTGRCGGLRIVSRQQGAELDDLFITAYAPQETDPIPVRQAFFLGLLEMLHAVPKRTRIWLMGDFNGHVGPETHSVSVGRYTEACTNHNGSSLTHACDASGLVLTNTFFGGGATWWSPDRRTSHALDFIAIRADCKPCVKQFLINTILGKRWQLSLVRDHFPVELTVQLSKPWTSLPPTRKPVRWNKYAVQVALEDPRIGNAFLSEVQQAWSQLPPHPDMSSPAELERHWTELRKTVHDIAVAHFGMRPAQRSLKMLPHTFDLLRAKRSHQHELLSHLAQWPDTLRCRQQHWCFTAWALLFRHVKLAKQAADAVKADKHRWNSHLEHRLHAALSHHDSREAWSVCRQLAGHGAGRILSRTAPAAHFITAQQWVDHMGAVWDAWSCHANVVRPGSQPELLCEPPLQGEAGRKAFFDAAKKQKRCRATPDGALPSELWQLLLDRRELAGAADSCTAGIVMQFFEAFQRVGYNPQVWCDGQGFPLPKPGGAAGPNGQRIINLLDLGGKLFYKALLGLSEDRPADHQYGFAAKRSRCDAILQVEAWLDRLRLNKLSSAATLYDLTKAFDTLGLPSINSTICNGPYDVATAQLLLDLHQRIRIKMSLADGADLCMKLERGVLQGGGTGPRIFREAFDACIVPWVHDPEPTDTVEYNGTTHVPSVAAFADDLIRISSGRTLAALQAHTDQLTATLAEVLTPHRLHLNGKKGETLVHFCGPGAYNAARAAFSGHWRGYPLKLTVKYLGAHLQDNGSLRAEIQRRISHAKAGFAQYALFFKLKRVPMRRKIAVFKAVVNESLLSALEVRPVSVSDIRQLEQARGLLLRRLFGREGFGSVANDHEHRSVTVSSLRQRAHLATVASELRVRRLLWLRRALLAEQQGQTRLELATLFGTSSTLRSCVALDSGEPTSYAPRFLHLLHSDLKHVWASYPGFRDNWKSGFLAIPYALLQGLRTTHSCDDDGRAPPQPEAPAPPLIMAEFRCEQCGAGPWPTQRALRSHMVTRHKHRHPVQGQTCPLCQRTFTTKTAAQRHFDRRSCGSLVCNHGHAGALEGQRQREAVPARVPPAPAAPQLQARLDRFFVPRHAARLPPASGKPSGPPGPRSGSGRRG